MDERKKRVLSAIINDYIANAEPVGSRTITKKYDLGVSPATIRNEMSDLEEEGYIEQPHTSAGRIPSAKGYRFFVDNLMEREVLSSYHLHQIRDVVSGEFSDLDKFMQSCCNMISDLTNYTAFAAVPERGSGRIAGIRLVRIGDRRILAMVIASTGIIQHKLIDLSFPVEEDDLIYLEQGLCNALVGQSLGTLNHGRLETLSRELQLRELQSRQTLALLEQALHIDAARRIFTGGMMNLLAQPEFHDIDKLKNIFTLLGEDDKIKELLKKSEQQDERLTVTIGGEIPVTGAQDCSMVVANYFVNGEKAGSIGVLGPTRMSYGRTVSLMEQIAAELSRVISEKNK